MAILTKLNALPNAGNLNAGIVGLLARFKTKLEEPDVSKNRQSHGIEMKITNKQSQRI